VSPQAAKLAGGLVTALVILQALSAVLLWQLVDDEDGGAPPAAQRAEPQPLPPLPEARTGGSARAILQELEATTRRLEEPLEGLQRGLTTATRQFAFLPAIPPLLGQIGANTSGFATLPAQLDALVAQTRSLGDISGSMALVVTELRRVSELTRAVARLESGLGGIRTSVEGVGSTAAGIGRSFDRAVVVLEQMARDVARMRECIERPAVCNAPAGPLGR
jgi:hypothetical protein